MAGRRGEGPESVGIRWKVDGSWKAVEQVSGGCGAQQPESPLHKQNALGSAAQPEHAGWDAAAAGWAEARRGAGIWRPGQRHRAAPTTHLEAEAALARGGLVGAGPLQPPLDGLEDELLPGEERHAEEGLHHGARACARATAKGHARRRSGRAPRGHCDRALRSGMRVRAPALRRGGSTGRRGAPAGRALKAGAGHQAPRKGFTALVRAAGAHAGAPVGRTGLGRVAWPKGRPTATLGSQRRCRALQQPLAAVTYRWAGSEGAQRRGGVQGGRELGAEQLAELPGPLAERPPRAWCEKAGAGARPASWGTVREARPHAGALGSCIAPSTPP